MLYRLVFKIHRRFHISGGAVGRGDDEAVHTCPQCVSPVCKSSEFFYSYFLLIGFVLQNNTAKRFIFNF